MSSAKLKDRPTLDVTMEMLKAFKTHSKGVP
jgi:hypothetical protein